MKKIILMLVLVLVSLSCSKNEEKPNVLVPVYSKLNLTVNCEAMDSGELPIIKVGDDEVAYQNGEVFEKKYIAGQSIKIETELGSKYVLIGYEGDVENTNKSIDIVLNSDKKITVRLELKTKEVTPVGAVYTISTPSELRWLAEESKTDNFENKTIKLANDINLRNYPFNGIAVRYSNEGEIIRFSGIFDGQGNEVSGLNIDVDTSESYLPVGFIGELYYGAKVKNLAISGTVRHKGEYATGGVVGVALVGTVIENCYNAAEIIHIGDGYVGGVVGSYKGILSNVYNTGNITSSSMNIPFYAGGITGNFSKLVDKDVVKYVYNIGHVDAKNRRGIIGSVEVSHDVSALIGLYFLSNANINTDVPAGNVHGGANMPASAKGFDVDKFASLDNFEGFDPAVWKIKTVKSVNGVSTRPVLIGVGEGRD